VPSTDYDVLSHPHSWFTVVRAHHYSQINWIHYVPFCIICISNSILNTKYHIIHTTPTKHTLSEHILIGLA